MLSEMKHTSPLFLWFGVAHWYFCRVPLCCISLVDWPHSMAPLNIIILFLLKEKKNLILQFSTVYFRKKTIILNCKIMLSDSDWTVPPSHQFFSLKERKGNYVQFKYIGGAKFISLPYKKLLVLPCIHIYYYLKPKRAQPLYRACSCIPADAWLRPMLSVIQS